ncbi:hypothetical protein EYR40_010140 [Pleurotus pulmonarius]|nr:hypothetical protein EYR36_010463 [Pleurotus pulmonarius]KAF4588587.1 hypothetical protein EYR40_010140 [Pleurotus pulmonarius]
MGSTVFKIRRYPMGSDTVFIDSQDSQIEYSPSWQTIASGIDYRNTASITTKLGASFTLRFIGTSFKVYGRLAKANSPTDFGAFPNTTYAIDGGLPTPFFGVPSDEGDLIDQMFYASPPLASTKHALVGTCVGEGAQVIVDYIAVELPVDGSVSPSNSSSSQLPATSPFSSSTTTTFKSVSTSSLSLAPAKEIPTASHGNASSSHAVVIVGGALGGSLFVVITLIFCLWSRLRVGGFLQLRSSKGADPPPLTRISIEPSSSTSNRTDDVLVCAESHKSPLPQSNYRNANPPTQ